MKNTTPARIFFTLSKKLSCAENTKAITSRRQSKLAGHTFKSSHIERGGKKSFETQIVRDVFV